MREFSKISTSIWRSKKFSALADDADAKLLYFYLLTAPHGNSAGAFILPVGYIRIDLGWTEERIGKAMDTLSKGYLVRYDAAESMVFVENWFAFNSPQNPKHAQKVFHEIAALPDGSAKFAAYEGFIESLNRAGWDVSAFSPDRVSKGYGKGIDTRQDIDKTKTETQTETGTRQPPCIPPAEEKTEKPQESAKSSKRPKNSSLDGVKAKRPDDVPEQVWNDFTAHRNAKRAPITPTVIDTIRREAGQIGMTLTEAISEMMVRGWQGFKAEWIMKDRLNGKRNNTTAQERTNQGWKEAFQNVQAARGGDNDDKIPY